MLLRSAAMVAKKLLVDEKQICLPCVICNVLNRKTLGGETFCFLKKRFLYIFKFCQLSNLLFFTS